MSGQGQWSSVVWLDAENPVVDAERVFDGFVDAMDTGSDNGNGNSDYEPLCPCPESAEKMLKKLKKQSAACSGI